ncbi:MAG: hypothetical protein ACRYG2_02850, partial [Janthinobacterium lividum]
SWMGATIQDSFWAPPDLLTEIQDFVADTEELRSVRSAHEVAVVYSVVSTRDAINEADSGDNLVNARNESVEVPFRRAAEALAGASVPFDVVLLTDGGLAGDRFGAEDLARYTTVVLPGCWWLTDHQVLTLLAHLDAGGHVVASGEVGTNAEGADRERLRTHPNLVVAQDASALDLEGGPQVTCSSPLAVNLHRLDDGRVAAHLVNYDHDDEQDRVRTLTGMELVVRLARHTRVQAEVHVPGQPVRSVPVETSTSTHRVVLDEVGAYTVVVFVPAEGAL